MKHTLALITILLLAPPAALHATEAPQGEPTNAAEAAAQKARAEAELETKYQAWVVSLTSEQQAWERVLQENLGGFYLPIHKSEKVAGKSNAWDFVADDPKLPRVLLIGDSISRGYTQAVRTALAGKVNVHRAPANCGPTATGLKKMDAWLGDGKWDVVHFNFGIHDRKTPLPDYEQRLEQIITRLQKTGAKLIWASTTPVPAGTRDGPSMPAAIVERNKIAAALMKKHGIAIDDLFGTLTPHVERVMKPDDVHPNGEGYKLLGKQVAVAIENAIK